MPRTASRRRFFGYHLAAGILLLSVVGAIAAEETRLIRVQDYDPYRVGRDYPKLITPQWVGEDGVEAVVILGIDDMRDPKKYEAFLRPILNRLKKIDGRAPLSIMTCQVKPDDPQLQAWLKEGLSLETHTIDHPCPLLKDGDFAKAKSTYDRCVDLMNEVPNSKPVAFRTPCCDSLNTVSPRIFSEIFNKTTAKGNFLTIDTSVFNLFTANDPELPRDLVMEANGQERFRKYLPQDRTFVNYVEDYPYPYVIGGTCWEFPCVVPSDWSAQHYHKQNASPITLRDWKAALDATVIKKGVFCLVFHPHGWSSPEQIVDLIDHAVTKHGKKVKFLNFRQAQERLDKNMLGGHPLRDRKTGGENGVLLSSRVDGQYVGKIYIDSPTLRRTRYWDPKEGWLVLDSTIPARVWDSPPFKGSNSFRKIVLSGTSAYVIDTNAESIVMVWDNDRTWVRQRFSLPPGVHLGNGAKDTGVRFIDLDEDGNDDIVFSNEKEYGIYLFTDLEHGWSKKVMAGKAGEPGALPPIAKSGTNNGFFVHSRSLWWQNENTNLLKDLVDRRSFNDILMNVEPTGKSPEASLRCIKTRPGFTVELVAAEPLVQSPIAFAWGPDGKLWVVEMGDYPLGIDGKGRPGGRVKYLEDTKGTGKYDKATVFLDNLPFPTGVMPWRKGVIVTCAPDIFYAEDTKGTGKADLRIPLYTGFREGNQQHRVNGPVWGLDNWIYVANGDSGGKVTSAKRKQDAPLDLRGRDLRIRPDTGEMDLVSGQTQYGRSRDDWGNWFGNNNSWPLYHYALDDHYIRRNPHIAAPDPRVQVSETPGASRVYPISRTLPRFNDPKAANHFTSACSAIVYRDELFGPNFVNNTFVSEPVHNLIHREVMRPNGTTFTSHRAADERESEFLASSDNWFRPTMIQTGPDGALWIADMYRAVIEHPEWIPKDWQQRIDLRAGSDKGRIYRVYPVGTKPRAIPRLDKFDTAGLVACFNSPSGWQRDMAQQMLIWKQDKAAIPLLEKVAVRGERPLARLHALCTLDGLGKLDEARVLANAIIDSHSGVRRHAIRLLETNAEFVTAAHDIDYAKSVVGFDDPQVRLQLAYSLGKWPEHDRMAKLLGEIAVQDQADPFISAAVMSSIGPANLDDVLITVLKSDTMKPPSPALLANLLKIALAEKQSKALVKLLKVLSKIEEEKDPTWRFTTLAGLLDALDQRRSSLTALHAEGNADLKTAVVGLGALFNSARRSLASSATTNERRTAATRLLGRGLNHKTEDIDLLAAQLVPQTDRDLQYAAVAALGKLSDARIPELLVRGWKGYSPGLRGQVFDAIILRGDRAGVLLDAVEAKKIQAAELDATRRQRLLSHTDGRIRDRAAKIFAGAVNADRQKVIDAYQPAQKLVGDTSRGAKVFAKTCATCHRLGDVGHAVGPDIASVGDKSPQGLLAAILDPNRVVEARYVNYLAHMKNGQTFTGVVASETGNSVTLMEPDGKQRVLLRTDLDELVSTGKSLMPDGLEKDLTHQDMADLIALIRGSAPVRQRKTFDGNKPEIVRPGADGILLLTAVNAEIYGRTLVFEKQYANLGYWTSDDDEAVWSAEVPKAGRYAVWLEWACENAAAGKRFVLECGTAELSGKVESTGNWDTYRKAQLGEMTLPPGPQRLTLRPGQSLRSSPLMDLKAIRLVPVK